MITARDLMRRAYRLMGDPHQDLTENDEALDDINEALRDLSTRSESIVYGQYLPAQKDVGQYALDADVLQIKFAGFKSQYGRFYDLSRGSVVDATVINQNRQSGFNPFTDPCTYEMGGRTSEQKIVSKVVTVHSQNHFAIGNPPSTLKVGDRVINTSDSNAQGIITAVNATGIEVDHWRGQTYPDIAKDDVLRILSADRQTDRGTVTIEVLGSPTAFQVSAFPAGLTNGDIIIDTTQNNAETTLQGFYDDSEFTRQFYVNPWAGVKVGDTIRIESPSRERQSLIISPAPSFSDSQGAASIYVHTAHQHRIITQAEIDAQNDTLDIDPELESALINLTASYFAIAEHGVTSAEAQMFEAKYEREFHKNIPSINSRIEEYKSLWFSGAYPQVQEQLRDDRSQTGNSSNQVNR